MIIQDNELPASIDRELESLLSFVSHGRAGDVDELADALAEEVVVAEPEPGVVADPLVRRRRPPGGVVAEAEVVAEPEAEPALFATQRLFA